MPDRCCPSGTGRPFGSTEADNEVRSLGKAWYRTLVLASEASDLVEDICEDLPKRVEPELRLRNTFLSFNVGSYVAETELCGKARRRTSSDFGARCAKVSHRGEETAEVSDCCERDKSMSTAATNCSHHEECLRSLCEESADGSSACSDAASVEYSSSQCNGTVAEELRTRSSTENTDSSENASCCQSTDCQHMQFAAREQIEATVKAMRARLGNTEALAAAALLAEVSGKKHHWQSQARHAKPACLQVAERLAQRRQKGSNDCWTTVTLKNIPAAMCRDDVVEALNSQGFKGLYDFVYVPIRWQTGQCFRYAFINFSSGAAAKSALVHFNGFMSWSKRAEAVLPSEAVWTDPFQGLLEHVERYRNSSVMHPNVADDHKPALFDGNGIRLPFPAPTLRLKAPRLERGHHNSSA